MFSDIGLFLMQVRDEFSRHIVFGIGILLTGSYFMGRLAERLNLPSITGFILAGLIIGPSCLGLVHADLEEALGSITEIALVLIAMVIGSEFNIGKLKAIGRHVFVITLFQLTATFVLVTAALAFAGLQLEIAALLGAIASATAPAATVAIIRDLKARGPFVDHLYGVVALDDAGCVLLFGLISAVASNTLGASTGILQTILHAVLEILLSIFLGALAGWLLHLLTRATRRTNEMLIISLGVLLLLSAMANLLHLSAILAAMTAGAVMTNLSKRTHRIITAMDSLSPPLYASFFAIAGTELDLSVLTSGSVLLLGGLFVVARAIGKIGGVYAGAAAVGSQHLIKRYLGLAMLPQAGVAIGLVLFLQSMPYFIANADISATIVNVVLFSVLINELAGPPLSRFAVVRGATL